jgi:ATP-dependent Clp protease adaptor protein ClpS
MLTAFPLTNSQSETEVETTPVRSEDEDSTPSTHGDIPWVVLVWNDPINLMSYVTHVLQKLFGYSTEKATQLMLDVHNKGRAVVSNGTREKAELDVFRLHEYGLWATMQKDS